MDIEVGDIIQGKGFPSISGIYNNLFYKITDINGDEVTLRRCNQIGDITNFSSTAHIVHKAELDSSLKAIDDMNDNGVIFYKKAYDITEGRSVSKIQKEYSQVLQSIKDELDQFKKKKGTGKEIPHVQNLKKLNIDKKRLEKELDSSVSGLYKDAELKIESHPPLEESASSKLYDDWDEYVNPHKIVVKLKSGKTLEIKRKNIKGGNSVYHAILKAFNDNKFNITDKVISAMLTNLNESNDDYIDSLIDRIVRTYKSKTIDGWKLQYERHPGTLLWSNPKARHSIYVTPGWSTPNGISIEIIDNKTAETFYQSDMKKKITGNIKLDIPAWFDMSKSLIRKLK